MPEGTRSRTLLLDTSTRNRASQEPDGHRQEWFPGDGTDSQPEALKLECSAEHSSFYLQTVDVCSEVADLRIVRAFALADST